MARRLDARTLSTDSTMYFCEDHFDLPNDMINYTEYHIMGKVSQVRMKPGCIPKKFECQEDRRTCSYKERPYMLKKQRMSIIAECLNEPEQSSTPSSSVKDTSSTSSDFQIVGENVPETPETLCQLTTDKSVQALITHKFRSKAVQAKVKSTEKGLSPLKPPQISTSTSPFKLKTTINSSPSVSGLRKSTRNISIESEQSHSDVSLYAPSASSASCLSMHSLQVKSSSDCSEFIKEDKKIEVKEAILSMMKKIENKPRLYIGVPKKCYYLIDIIKDEINITEQHLCFCLNKIRLNSSFNLMSDDYAMTPSYLSKIFSKNIPLIASVMKPFIVSLDSEMIKKTLPMAFRHKYHNVSCIIDCLEIEVEKPSRAMNQAFTWSDYKKSNTKYLISCTPNGLVNYISPGFGGRTTDTCIVESCDFVQTLKSGMFVMADRGFKHLEQYLKKAGITLVRPPSVEKGVQMSKTEAKLTKQIASLRIHIERVIRRLREFRMLKPHACVNFKFVKLLDDITIIACALINLQGSLIK
ncbi:uncharacterized protein LOC125235212 [Leguminivora glycinivorella]|uniref:uncharacterized protein LOC125235212 n=1 Tax=Leguminivora glycinivorella TaxID=1035111 RepID=UPI0020105C0A|nr:uncharacterized protein LOC125235212 [Leguminivora glycinivorella]